MVGTIGIGARPGGVKELGYWIARPFWGLGYATEAGAALIAIARDGLRLKRLQAGHFLDNPASGRGSGKARLPADRHHRAALQRGTRQRSAVTTVRAGAGCRH
jgi:hypothetical protein